MEQSVEQRVQDTYKAALGSGWPTFAGVMLVIVGVLQAVFGIAALAKSKYVSDVTLFGPLALWGVILLVVGGLCLLAGYAMLNRQPRGRELGIGAASLSVIAEFLFVAGNPWWALFTIAISLSIIYALVVPGDGVARP